MPQLRMSGRGGERATHFQSEHLASPSFRGERAGPEGKAYGGSVPSGAARGEAVHANYRKHHFVSIALKCVEC
jgi:hypothetical protein